MNFGLFDSAWCCSLTGGSTSVQCLLVCVSVCEYVFVCVLLLFFTDCRIHLFSSLAARLFNKLTRYSWLFRMEWRPAGWSRSSLLAPAHLGSSGKRAVKWLCVCECILQVFNVKRASLIQRLVDLQGHEWCSVDQRSEREGARSNASDYSPAQLLPPHSTPSARQQQFHSVTFNAHKWQWRDKKIQP